MSHEALIAEFLAKGGRVNKVEPGAKALNLSDREWRLQTQMTRAERLGITEDDDFAIENRAERRQELARDFAHVGDRQAAIEAASGAFDL